MSIKPIPPIPRKNFFKVWFGNHREYTAGIVLDKEKQGNMTIAELSRMFPISEAPKMKYFHRSGFYLTYEEAFAATIADVSYSARVRRS